MGSGTTAVSAELLGRRWLGIEYSSNYVDIATNRIKHFIEERNQTELELE
jgi:DNA modification methylase